MPVINYIKLVRDRIPEIIEAAGKTCVCETLSGSDYIDHLDKKLTEEVAEYQESKSLEELADLLEVMRAVVMARGWSLEALEQVRAKKAAKRGGFEKRILLKKVVSPVCDTSLATTVYENRGAILNKLDHKMIATYFWLQDHLQIRNTASDVEYRKKFAGFYRMRFVSQEYRDCFFEILEEQKVNQALSFRDVSRRLYDIDGKHEFSFISKMLHTIDPHRPIYDSQVDAAIGIKRGYTVNFEEKLREDERILQLLGSTYQSLSEDERMGEVMLEFDKLLPERTMTVEKKLDFILWALGAVLKESR